MSQIIDLLDKLHEKRIEKNNAKNERYVIRNELVKCLNVICTYDLEKHNLLGLKENIVNYIVKLNLKINEDSGKNESKDPPNY